MEKNSDITFESFKDRYCKAVSEFRTLNQAMFMFGLKMKSYHHSNGIYRKEYFVLPNPFVKEYSGQWNTDMLRKLQNGADDNGAYDELEDYSGPLRIAIQLLRPTWGIYYLIGELKGYMNYGEISGEYFLNALQLCPTSFLKEHISTIAELCNYFDEQNLVLNYKIVNDHVEIWYESTN